MAMNRLDTAKFVVALTERIRNENTGIMQTESELDEGSIYSKVFSAVSPLIINGDIDSQMWVDLAEYLFPNVTGKITSIIKDENRIKVLEKELRDSNLRCDTLQKDLSATRKKCTQLTKEIEEKRKPTTKSTVGVMSYDPCGLSSRSSYRSGGC